MNTKIHKAMDERDKGFTLVANVGNNKTDFQGGGYEKAYRLPNYGGQLK